jgi:CRP-like cAMP-binding protein
MDTQDASLLRAFPLFTELPDAVIQALNGMAITRSHSAGAIIQLEGDPVEATFIVLKGQVKILRSSSSGREQVIHIATPGQNINLVPVLDGGPNPATVQALTNCTLLSFPCEPLRALIRREPALAVAMLTDLAARQRRLVGLIDELALHTVQGRLASLLITRAEAAERGIPIPPMTQADMANHLGTVREMVSRTLKTFEGLGLIELKQGAIVVKDRKGLEEKIEG